MKFTSLFSGSSGNCSLIESKDSKILLDIGVSYTKIKKALHEVNLTPTDIDAVFITHEHSDHISGLPRWLLYNSVRPVFVHERGYEALSQKTQWKSYSVFNKEFVFRDIRVSTYECCHDSAYCCGYRFFDTTGDIAVVTDTGVATMALVDFVRGARTVMLESNYDAELLLEGNYPYMLKQRIMSEHGHLSNEQNSQIVERIAKYGLHNLILGHLSEHNNTEELARGRATTTLHRLGAESDIKLVVASHTQRSITLE